MLPQVEYVSSNNDHTSDKAHPLQQALQRCSSSYDILFLKLDFTYLTATSSISTTQVVENYSQLAIRADTVGLRMELSGLIDRYPERVPKAKTLAKKQK
jgi:hypothetical protein